MNLSPVADALVEPRRPGTARLRIGELLVQGGKFAARDLDRALAAQQELGGLIGRVLLRLGLMSEADLMRALSAQLGLELVAASAFPAFVPEIEGLNPQFLVNNHVCPLRIEGSALHVAMVVPQDAFLLKALGLATGLSVRPYLALEADIERALAEPVAQDAVPDAADDGLDGAEFVEHLKDLASEAPVIHLEPFDDGLHVCYRVDGFIHPGELVPPRTAARRRRGWN